MAGPNPSSTLTQKAAEIWQANRGSLASFGGVKPTESMGED